MSTTLNAPTRSGAADAAAPGPIHALPASRPGAVLAFLHFALFVVTLIVLSAAIGWPGVLREPADVVFQRITGSMTATQAGYFSYLFSSLLMIPLALLIRELFTRTGVAGWWIDPFAFLGAAAGVLKALGIVRWLLTMPLLARNHAQATSDAGRQMVESVYLGVNAYGGSVGELLGVHLFSGLWIAGTAGVLLVRYGKRWVGLSGLLVAALTLVLATRPFLPEVGALESVSGPLWLAWLLGLSVMLWRGKA